MQAGSEFVGHPLAAVSDVPLGAQLQERSACLWVAGPGAVAMERRSSSEMAADVEQLLDIFPALKQTLPNAASVIRTTWGTDPLFRGSYSFVSAASSLHDIEGWGTPSPLFCRGGHASQPLWHNPRCLQFGFQRGGQSSEDVWHPISLSAQHYEKMLLLHVRII